MMTKRNAFIIFVGLLLAVQVFFVGPVAAEEVKVDAVVLEKLQKIIQDQQEQLDSLKKQVDDLKKTSTLKVPAAPAPTPKTVTSGQDRVKLAISGQVNRMVNVIDDGDNTTAYFVDNDNSNTRVRFVGTAKATEDLTLGSKLEVAMTSNESGEVSQDNETAGDFFNVRWADLTLASKRYGKLWMGRGDTASNNTAEVDLSRTDVIGYSSIADTAGGMLFRETSGNNSLTNVSIGDAFKNQDGLSRQSRVRYDTPSFWGFHLAGSAVSNQRYDGALKWGGQGYGFKAAGAVAVAEPNKDKSDLQYDGSFSILHENSGLNLTLSAGLLDRNNEGDPTNLYAKLGWLAHFFSVGHTALGLDYTKSMNLPTGRDEGYSVGLQGVQLFEKYGTELYMQYRLYSLDRDVARSVEDMHVGTIGARVKF